MIALKTKNRRKELHQKFPWKRVLQHIKQRCNNPNSKDYKWYGGRGVKCLITEEELEYLWNRNNASKMLNPSIDRKDNDGNYTLDNCQFIELSENLADRNTRTPKISVLQYDLEGHFIQEWLSMRSIERELKIGHKEISSCCKGVYKKAGGYIWKYKLIEVK